jgi:hypothetical protein
VKINNPSGIISGFVSFDFSGFFVNEDDVSIQGIGSF